MTSKVLCFWIRFTIIAIACCGLYICIFLYPFLTSISPQTNLIGDTRLHLWIAFLRIVSIPCFIILIFIWFISIAIKKENVFTKKTSNHLKICAQLLFIDTGILFVGSIVFTLLKIIDFFIPIVFLLVIAGFAVAVFIAILSRYIAKAAILKEESEGTI